jgi:hypothetical protein
MELRKSRVGKECESFDTDGEEKRREEKRRAAFVER